MENVITLKKQYKGFCLELCYDKESDFYIATAMIGSEQIASAMFEYANWLGGWCGNEIEVDKKYRRQGIMTQLYNWVEIKTNSKIVPTKTLTKASRAFWKNRQNAK